MILRILQDVATGFELKQLGFLKIKFFYGIQDVKKGHLFMHSLKICLSKPDLNVDK